MPRTYTGPRGSTGTPMLADYLRANQQQGAQQAGQLAQGLTQQGQQARSAVNAAQEQVKAARLGTSNPLTTEQAQQVVSGPEVDFAKAGVDSGALQQQVGRATTNAGMAQSIGGIGTLNAMRYGTAAPRTSGASAFDAAVTQSGGGKQLRAAARPYLGLQDYMAGAAKRGNEAAVAQAQQTLAAPPVAPPAPVPKPPKPPPDYSGMPTGPYPVTPIKDYPLWRAR